ncbi:MAG: hypothetical protein ACJAWL_001208 [Motiliproteus sp.]|jgi:hypothetical protein
MIWVVADPVVVKIKIASKRLLSRRKRSNQVTPPSLQKPWKGSNPGRGQALHLTLWQPYAKNPGRGQALHLTLWQPYAKAGGVTFYFQQLIGIEPIYRPLN